VRRYKCVRIEECSPLNPAKSCEDLLILQEARGISVAIRRITQAFPFSADRVLVHQVRRAALSVVSNIAEEFERGSRGICPFPELCQRLQWRDSSPNASHVRSELHLEKAVRGPLSESEEDQRWPVKSRTLFEPTGREDQQYQVQITLSDCIRAPLHCCTLTLLHPYSPSPLYLHSKMIVLLL